MSFLWTMDGNAQVPCSTTEAGDTIVTDFHGFPHPKKGMKRYGKWISANMDKKLRSKEKEARKIVYVLFIVHKDGTRSNFEIAKGVGEPYDSEALRLVRANPQKWVPAQCDSKILATKAIIPVRF